MTASPMLAITDPSCESAIAPVLHTILNRTGITIIEQKTLYSAKYENKALRYGELKLSPVFTTRSFLQSTPRCD